MRVFDRGTVRRHRDRAAAGLEHHEFLFREVADRLADRLADVARHFPTALDLGCHTGQFAEVVGGRGGIERLVQTDLSPAMLHRGRDLRLAADEEFLPFRPHSFDLVVSVLSLHWVNDLPGALVQINRALKPDGLFLAAILGGGSLPELRQAWLTAEATLESGASPHVSPFVDIRDAGGLLQRAGFALPVVDSDDIVASYAEPFTLMRELRGMGESNAVRQRRQGFSRRQTVMAMADAYISAFADGENRVPATFQILYLTAWTPHESQQQPLRPGSAKSRLAEALGVPEHSAGEKAAPDRASD